MNIPDGEDSRPFHRLRRWLREHSIHALTSMATAARAEGEGEGAAISANDDTHGAL